MRRCSSCRGCPRSAGLQPQAARQLADLAADARPPPAAAVTAPVAVVSMGNPHAVLLVDDVDAAPVADWGPLIEHHRTFPRRVNAVSSDPVAAASGCASTGTRRRRDLACGTGACAAVVAGIRLACSTSGSRCRRGWSAHDQWALSRAGRPGADDRSGCHRLLGRGRTARPVLKALP